MDAFEERKSYYLHGVGASEQMRLEVEARFWGGSEFLPPLHSGMRILDVGCGTGAIAREVAIKVAPGEVIGIDQEEAQIETARRLAAVQGTENVRFLQGDAAALDLPDASFDAVYCRFLLEHVADPVRAVGEMRRVVKPSGWVCAYEWEVGCLINYPDSPAIEQVWQGIYRLQKVRGGDPWIGRKLYGVFLQVGLIEVKMEGLAWTITGDEKEELRLYVDAAKEIIRQTRQGLLTEHLVTQEVLVQAEDEYQRLLDSPIAFVFHGFCRAVGKKSD